MKPDFRTTRPASKTGSKPSAKPGDKPASRSGEKAATGSSDRPGRPFTRPQSKSFVKPEGRLQQRPFPSNERAVSKEDEPESEIVFGRNAVIELLKSTRDVEKVYYLASNQPRTMTDIYKLAKDRKIPCVMAMNDKFHKAGLSEQTHQGVFALVSPITYMDLDEFLGTVKSNTTVAILDEIEDVHNLGAIIRSAEVFGFSAIILPLHHSAPLSGAAVKTSAGAVHFLPIIKVANLALAIQKLKDTKFWVYGLDMGGDTWSEKSKINFPAAVVIGSEGKGIRPLVKKSCDNIIGIPQAGKINSLNASVAAGIMFWEVSRRK